MKQFTQLISAVAIVLVGCAEQADVDVVAEEPQHDADKICGDDTVASARAPNGNLVVFCVVDGVEVIGERGVGSALQIADATCALDAFLAITAPTTPVPVRLLDSCVQRGGNVSALARTVSSAPVFVASPDDGLAPWNLEVGSYCGVDGPANFSAERCSFCNSVPGADLCAKWCINEARQKSFESIKDTLGEQGNWGRQYLASCNGTTLFRGLRDRGAVDPEFRTLASIEVLSGQTWNMYMSYTPANGEDAWFQFIGESYGYAWHRHSGFFYDDK